MKKGSDLEVFDAIKGRRSTRKYKADSIPDELIEKIAEAGRWAPSASNIQPWQFIVINNPKILDMVRKFSPGFFGEAPSAILVCSDRERAHKLGGDLGRNYLAIADCAMAVQNMLLAAYALGLGGCPIKSFSHAAIKEILEIPNNVEPELLVAIGYPNEKPSPPPKRPLAEITYFNKYGVKWGKA